VLAMLTPERPTGAPRRSPSFIAESHDRFSSAAGTSGDRVGDASIAPLMSPIICTRPSQRERYRTSAATPAPSAAHARATTKAGVTAGFTSDALFATSATVQRCS
jgi:hypothetical protein